MSRPAQRKTDANDAGGVIENTDGNSTVFANNLLLSVNGSIGSGHGIGVHSANAWETQGGSVNVFAHNVPINYTGNTDTCGHGRVGGSPNVYIGTSGDYNLEITSAEVTFTQEVLDVDTYDDISAGYISAETSANISAGISSGVLGATATSVTVVGTPDTSPPPPSPSALPPDPGSSYQESTSPQIADWNQFNENNVPYSTLMLTPKTSLAEFTTKTALWPNQPTPIGPTTNWKAGARGDNKHLREQDYFIAGKKAGRITVPQILHNLSNLAKNVWEPFKQRYPQAIITNTFRQSPPGGQRQQAQHGLGMAMDIQLPGASAAQYLEACIWIRDNLPFDQLLQEKAGKVQWIHVSHFSGFGYKVAAVNKIANMVVSPTASFTPGLALMA